LKNMAYGIFTFGTPQTLSMIPPGMESPSPSPPIGLAITSPGCLLHKGRPWGTKLFFIGDFFFSRMPLFIFRLPCRFFFFSFFSYGDSPGLKFASSSTFLFSGPASSEWPSNFSPSHLRTCFGRLFIILRGNPQDSTHQGYPSLYLFSFFSVNVCFSLGYGIR